MPEGLSYGLRASICQSLRQRILQLLITRASLRTLLENCHALFHASGEEIQARRYRHLLNFQSNPGQPQPISHTGRYTVYLTARIIYHLDPSPNATSLRFLPITPKLVVLDLGQVSLKDAKPVSRRFLCAQPHATLQDRALGSLIVGRLEERHRLPRITLRIRTKSAGDGHSSLRFAETKSG
ncbi:hypothetical protein NEOLEDRAFT_185378 [Neolentinus lepideus HHB14362 ss-1]|uniref:Uncharacterized protein n=1 Tax=Neolentinus lepideus HHB14362 ss-1 TaxID=1314782 RepID=A0A165TPR8_9AGAM|nr:hypothetical protein NEOLEDRAFT_185378 [Neolentinus lepideus HHB14362 ss-1]